MESAGATRQRARGERLLRALLVGGAVLIGVVLPLAWIVGAWWLGPRLDHVGLPFLTPLLFASVVIGLVVSVAATARWLLAMEARLARRTGRERAIRVRAADARRVRPEVPVLDEPERPSLTPSRRIAAAALVAFMALGSVGLIVGAPLGSVWVVSQFAETTQPQMGPYVAIAIGTTLAMVAGVRVLLRLQLAYARIAKASVQRTRRSAWLASYAAERGVRRPQRGLETVLVTVVIVAGMALAAWFFALDEPSGLVPPQMRGG